MKITPMSVELIDHMGSDLSVVNAARVSFAKQSDWEWVKTPHPEITDGYTHKFELSNADQKLISYLARHNHWSPFAHAFLSFRIKVPIFVARQLGKHQVGLAWNEVSRRYVSEEPEFWFPATYRKAADNVKQGSSDENVTPAYSEMFSGFTPQDRFNIVCERILRAYTDFLEAGMCAEQARMILPQNMQTEFIWSGSLQAFARVYQLRIEGHAQREVQDFAKLLGAQIPEGFKHSWEALTNG